MAALQKHLLQLMADLDEACLSQGIPYALFGNSAAWAAEKGKLTAGCCEMHIMMRACDIPKLKAALAGREGREFEDFSTNAKLAYSFVRYVDSTTTLIDREDPVCYDACGVAVTIHPLFGAKLGRIAGALFRNLARLHGSYNTDSIADYENVKSDMQRVKKMVDRFGTSATKRVVKAFSKDPGFGPDDKCWRQNNIGTLTKMSGAYIFQTQRIEVNGREFNVPEKLGAHMKGLLGEKWDPEKADKPRSTKSFWVLADAETPYREAIAIMKGRGIDLRAEQQERFEYACWLRDSYDPMDRDVMWDYSHATLARDRIDTYLKMEPTLPELRRAREEEDIPTLRKLLAPYFSITKKYANKEIGFYINDEIYSIARYIWDRDKKTPYAEHVLELVIPEHRALPVEEYLAQAMGDVQ